MGRKGDARLPRRRRHPVEVRKEAILEATVGLIERNGLANVRVKDVGAAMGVSPGLVFYHFSSKDELVTASFAHAFERELADLEEAVRTGDPMTKMRRFLPLFGPPGATSGWRIWTDACALALRQDGLREVMQRIEARYTGAFCRIVEEGVAAGVFRCASPEASTLRIFALNDGLSTAVVIYGSLTRLQLLDLMSEQISSELGLAGSDLRPAVAGLSRG